jgi:hypothetical protein
MLRSSENRPRFRLTPALTNIFILTTEIIVADFAPCRRIRRTGHSQAASIREDQHA